ncbi:acyl carrier protein [Brevinema andersonii]|uniref:Acyl carrier protein n=1 Tax=Brevinema andersonii TaxID=34097 RepID=A0A1I1D3C7_BREAD|nr:acyl carrier protein [Brevinema andersonii]SFB69425.1 acyl carrier protein [Brevinema andersonii]
MSDTFNKVKALIIEKLNVNPSDVTETATFIEDLGADSLDIVDFVMALEEEFGVDIPDEEAQKIKTVKDAVDFIEKNC